MNRQNAEKIITEYLKPIFGFALKRCKSAEDAEDLSQEIIMKAFRALLVKEDIGDVNKFIWAVAHNALSNYYRFSSKSIVGTSIDEVAELIASPNNDFGDEEEENRESIRRLRSEIAYLSKLQRKIVIAYYFENRKQAEIASQLQLPLGTVKWHLFEAKKELKRGMENMRKTSDLTFNPIKFKSRGFNGRIGTKSPDELFRSALTQNICYCVRNSAKTVNEIAEALGVSPVYIEGEVTILEEYGYLQVKKDKYIANFIIDEPTKESLVIEDKMYKQVAALFANDLYDELMSSGILDDPDIHCGEFKEDVEAWEISEGGRLPKDYNFLLWTLLPYIAAQSGEALKENKVTFDEVATIRPDGGHNIFHASVAVDNLVLPEDYVYITNWSGPMWTHPDQYKHWQIDSEWSNRDMERLNMRYVEDSERVLALYKREATEPLSKDDYTWLAERGYVKMHVDENGSSKAQWQIVHLTSKEIHDKLVGIGDRIKEKHKEEFTRLKEPYREVSLAGVPDHLKKVREYEQQSIFYSDALFLGHCIVELLRNGKLQEPTDEQRKILTTLITEV